MLVPAYICDSLLAGLSAASAEVSFYHVNGTLDVDWEDAARQIEAFRPQLLLVIHYFGRLQDQQGLSALRDAFSRLTILEDLTHSLLNAPGRQGWPGLADYGLASLRKLLPVPDGAVVLDYRGAGLPAEPAPTPEPSDFALARLAGELEHAENLLDAAAPVVPPHPLTLRLLPRLPAAMLRRRRRANWRVLAASLEGAPGVRPLQATLEDGQAPLGFPVRCANRHDLRARLRAARFVSALHWPLPQSAARYASRAERLLAGTLLTLPVDPGRGPEDMRRLAGLVRAASTP